MKNEVNVQRSKLFPDGMLHIEFLDGNSYLYSLEEIADIIAAQQSVQADGAYCSCKEPRFIIGGMCEWCGLSNRPAANANR